MKARIEINEGVITGKLRGSGNLRASLRPAEVLRASLRPEGVLHAVVVIGALPERYRGPSIVDPGFEEQILDTKDKMMASDVTVQAIRVSKTYNPEGGTTVYIGGVF